MPKQESPKRRWPLRLIAAGPGCLLSAIFVATQIPAVREAIGIANEIYRFTNSTVPSLGVAAIWIGFVLIVGGAVAAWQSHRVLKEGATKTTAVGSAVLAVALGGLVAVVSTLSQPGPGSSPAPPSYEARVVKHHPTRHRHHHHRTLAHRPSSAPSKAPAVPSPAPTHSTPAPAPAPAPASQPSGGGGSSANGSGGGNTVTITKINNQDTKSGNAEGPGATSGPATSNNSDSSNVSIGSIG